MTAILGFLTFDYNTRVVLLGTLSLGAAAGVIGTVALLRRRALLGDALAHATLPGVWIAFLLFGKNFSFLMLGAMATGLLGVATVSALSKYTRIKEDASIGIVLSVFFGAGLMLSGWVHHNSTNASQSGIDSYLLGKTAGMLASDARFICVVGLIVVAAVLLLYKELKLLCFDPEFAAVQGWRVGLLDFALMILLTATTVIGLPAVGVVLMVALLILPGAAARFWSDRLSVLLVLAGVFGLVIAGTGTMVSAAAARLPAGPVIVLCGTVLFAASMLFAPRRGVLARWSRTRSHRRRRVRQRIVQRLFEAFEKDASIALASLSELSQRIRVDRRSFNRAVNRLIRDHWIVVGSGGVGFTDHGWDRALRTVRTIRLWEQYLLTHANIDRDLVDPDVDVIESLLSTAVIHELELGLIESGRLPRDHRNTAIQAPPTASREVPL